MPNEEKEHWYVLYWKTGKTELVQGTDITKAFANAGYGYGAISALDFYTLGTTVTHEWTGKKWIRIKMGS